MSSTGQISVSQIAMWDGTRWRISMSWVLEGSSPGLSLPDFTAAATSQPCRQPMSSTLDFDFRTNYHCDPSFLTKDNHTCFPNSSNDRLNREMFVRRETGSPRRPVETGGTLTIKFALVSPTSRGGVLLDSTSGDRHITTDPSQPSEEAFETPRIDVETKAFFSSLESLTNGVCGARMLWCPSSTSNGGQWEDSRILLGPLW